MDVEVKVPATVANLGPGFDCLGVAVGVHLKIKVMPAEVSAITGKETRAIEDSLIFRSYLEAFKESGVEAPEVQLEMIETYPSARGLGASASAIVAGLVSARAAGDLPLSDADLASLAIRIEGHSDNVLPALFGGLVLSSPKGWMKFKPTDDIAPMLLVAGEKFKTEDARRVLPVEVPRSDAVANASATAALIAVLTGEEPPEGLLWATEDRLHEPYRLPLMPATLDLHQTLRAEGIATALSGAGPSLICLVETSRLEEAEALARKRIPDGWNVLTPGWDLVGARVR